MKILIRRAVAEDASAILELNATFNDVRATVIHIKEHIETRAHFETPFVATIDDHVVGLACLRLLPCLCDSVPYAELTELIVDPHYRRQGVGKSLVRYIEREASLQGALNLSLTTTTHNKAAQSFYHAMGYRRSEISMQRPLVDY